MRNVSWSSPESTTSATSARSTAVSPTTVTSTSASCWPTQRTVPVVFRRMYSSRVKVSPVWDVHRKSSCRSRRSASPSPAASARARASAARITSRRTSTAPALQTPDVAASESHQGRSGGEAHSPTLRLFAWRRGRWRRRRLRARSGPTGRSNRVVQQAEQARSCPAERRSRGCGPTTACGRGRPASSRGRARRADLTRNTGRMTDQPHDVIDVSKLRAVLDHILAAVESEQGSVIP